MSFRAHGGLDEHKHWDEEKRNSEIAQLKADQEESKRQQAECKAACDKNAADLVALSAKVDTHSGQQV